MEKFYDRTEAGKILAKELKAYAKRSDVIVLALPRGGVPVAYEIAKALTVPLDILVVRKLGVPGHEELAMGAIATHNSIVFNQEIINNLNISKSIINQVIQSEKKELKRREVAYRGDRPFPELTDKTVILVDDGIATGATMRAAIVALGEQQLAQLIVAVPVAAVSTCEEIAALVDQFVCPLRPTYFYGVSMWYTYFSQTTDEEVYELLAKANHQEP